MSAAFLAAAVPVARTDDKLKSEMKDGKVSFSVVAAPPKVEASIANVKATEKEFSFTLKTVQTFTQNGQDQKFASERKEILGSISTDAFPSRAKLTATDKETTNRFSYAAPPRTRCKRPSNSSAN